MKEYKMNMTRSEFLSTFAVDGSDSMLSFDELNDIFPGSYDIIYCTYSALIEADIYKTDIDYVNIDADDDVVIKLHNKATAKKIKESFRGNKIRIGEKIYKLEVTAKNTFVYVSVVLTNPEILGCTIIDLNDYKMEGLYKY